MNAQNESQKNNTQNTILVPIDFSDCALGVVENATRQASQQNWRLVLLHVADLPSGLPADAHVGDKTALEVLEDEAQARFPVYVDVARRASVEVETRVEVGPPATSILAVADEIDPAMIVMGTHGRRGLSRLMLGSVSEAVLKAARCPVLTLRTQHHTGCSAGSCAWCPSHVTEAEVDLRAELNG